MSGHETETSQSSDHHEPIPIASICDITSVDIDQLDDDSIEQLQLVLRRLQRQCDNVDDDATMTSECDQIQQPVCHAVEDATLVQTELSEISYTSPQDLTVCDHQADHTLQADFIAQQTSVEAGGETSVCQPSALTECSEETSVYGQQPEMTSISVHSEDCASDYKPQDTEPMGLHCSTCTSKPQDSLSYSTSELALILRLQRDMAAMQIQLSNLQDAMRTANATLQLLLNRAFTNDEQ